MTQEEKDKTGVTGVLKPDTERKIAFYSALLGLLDLLFKIFIRFLEILEIIAGTLEPRSTQTIKKIKSILEEAPRRLIIISVIIMYEFLKKRDD